MKVTPHAVAETMMEHRAADFWRNKRAASYVLHLVRQAVLFDFGTVHPDMAHKDFSLDLYERGLFSLPFPVTAFAFEAKPNHPLQTYAGSRPAGAMMVLSQDDDKRISAIMCTEMRDEYGTTMGAIPFAIVLHAKLSNPSADHSVSVDEETFPLVDDRMMAAMYGSADARGHDSMRNRLCSNLVGCMGMTVMLMSKGVETEHHAASDKLNKAREKKGKPKIGDRYVVRVCAGDAYSIGDGESIAGHVRGSPRMHWRRGHFRTIGRGAETERVVPVAPALIGANENAGMIRKSYEVRR